GAEKDSGVADLESKPKPAPKPRLPPKEEIRQAKEDLARIAGNISEDPEENIGQLGSLAHIAESENVTVQKLALGTQLAVYKDIIPGYRIRPLTKDDMNAKLSKDVRKLRSFEQSLLGGYKDYVKSLEKLASDDKLAAVATGCACNLITSVSHFNCRNELLAILVKKLSTRHLTPEGVKSVEALEQLFRDDEEGHASLEAVSQLTKMLKSRNYQVHESALNSFLHLRLLSEFSQKASTTSVDRDHSQSNPKEKMKKKDREFRTKRERKLVKERKAVEKEMKEADAAVSYETRDKNQAETLKM
ncbi:nucleolar complex-associated protein 3, partial [Hortaea werneckii]